MSLRNFIREALNEGKVQDLEKKYVSDDKDDLTKITPNVFKRIAAADPSPTKKYLDWMCKQYISDAQGTLADIFSSIAYFHQNVQRFPKKDIYAYKTLKELEDEVKRIGKINQAKNEKLGNAKKLYEDDQFLLIRPDDKNAVMKYGANTQWCITMRDANYYEDYVNDGCVFYFMIDKIADDNDNQFAKVAIVLKRDPEEPYLQFFDAVDEEREQEDIIENFGAFAPQELFAQTGSATQTNKNQKLASKLISLAKADVHNAPKPFIVRLKEGSASEQEVLSYWKANFDDRSRASRMMKSEKLKIAAMCSYKLQRAIGTIDEAIKRIIKNGGYIKKPTYGTYDVVYPKRLHPWFVRKSDGKEFIEMNQLEDDSFEIESFNGDGERDVVHGNPPNDLKPEEYEFLTKRDTPYINQDGEVYQWMIAEIPDVDVRNDDV